MRLLRETILFTRDVFRERKILWGLAMNDFRAKFSSSFLGGIWGIIQPLVTLLVMWVAFQAGFKSAPIDDIPFIVWLTPAYIAWSFFAEALNSGTNCMMEYSYLVRKVNFHVSIIPIVKIISSAFVHVALIVFLVLMMIVNHVSLSFYNFQVIYYFFCTCALLLGMCWLLSAMAPFAKDVSNIVSVFIQIGFWLTPIIWSADGLPMKAQVLLRINPMLYICTGYRDSFINHKWFWERPYVTLSFWVTVLIFAAFGAYLFKKLRPQFADVL